MTIPLSICIPTFERPALLRRAITSVIADSDAALSEFEVVVCDDSRDDRSAQLCEQLFASWRGTARRLENRPGLGMVENFNRCIASASGRYVMILHDDDYLLPGAVTTLVEATSGRSDGYPVLLFGVVVVDETGRIRRRQSFRQQRYLPPQVALRNLLSNSSYVRFPGIVVRADAYATAGPFDATLGGTTDLDMWIRLFGRDGVQCLPHTTSAYSVHPAAHSAGMSNRETIGMLAVIFDRVIARGLLTESVVRGYQADFFAQFILGSAYRHLRVGDADSARRIMALFKEPQVRSLGGSRRWFPVRALMSTLIRTPAPLLSGTARWLERVYPDTSILWPR
jgi:glycosyltransferase involved in cell wall biosynthesis